MVVLKGLFLVLLHKDCYVSQVAVQQTNSSIAASGKGKQFILDKNVRMEQGRIWFFSSEILTAFNI